MSVEVVESCWGDWWVVRDGRVVAVYLSSTHDGDGFAAALAQADELSGEFGFAVYGFGIVPRCHAADYLVGEPGRVYERNGDGLAVREGPPVRAWRRSE